MGNTSTITGAILYALLAFTVASGAGIGALTSVSSSGQGLGINTGVSLYYPGTGGNGRSSNLTNNTEEKV